MLSSRKSIANFIETAQGPFLIHFRYWFECRIKEGSQIRIQFGKRPFLHINNYSPGDRYVVIDIATRNTMPVCKIESTDDIAWIQLKKYQPGLYKQYSVNLGKNKFFFVFQLLSNTNDIYSIYQSDKTDNEERLRYNESVNDFLRSQAQFLAKFQRDLQLQQLNRQEKMQSQLEAKLSNELVSIKSIQFNIKTLISIFLLFLFVGYVVTSPEPIKKRGKKKPVTKKNKNR